jgi:catechol-2,3-dioxygenase
MAETTTKMRSSSETKGVPRWLGHVALRVRDIDNCVEFYSKVIGMTLRARTSHIAFLGIRPDASHEIALMPLPADALDPDPKRVGMYHFAWEMDSFEELEALHDRLLEMNVRIAGYSPATNSANVMFFDPEGNEQEAIWEPTPDELQRAKDGNGGETPRLKRAPGF